MRPQPGFEKCRYVFFPGCQACADAPEAVWRAYADLSARLAGGVGIMLGCCGIMSDWAGREELFAETREKLARELEALGRPKIITACPTCTRAMSALGECAGVWDVLLDIGLPEGAPTAAGRSRCTTPAARAATRTRKTPSAPWPAGSAARWRSPNTRSTARPAAATAASPATPGRRWRGT